jgi:predicted MPP superfamily phosphohydrolase
LRKEEGGIALVGVDDLSGPRFGSPGPLFASALDGVPREMPRILLSHQPDSIDWSPDGFALQLSGHTHGGQINPGFRPIDLVHRYVSGRYQVGATTLYVNRGFGVVGPPARVQAPPEVTRIVLVSA